MPLCKQQLDSKIAREQQTKCTNNDIKDEDPALILAHQVGEGKPELLDDWDQRLVVSFFSFRSLYFL